MSNYPVASAAQFTASKFRTAEQKAQIVNSTVRFLESGMAPNAFNEDAYEFFSLVLSMSAEYDRHGFIATHFESDQSKRKFVHEVVDRVNRYARLDTERNSDMAQLFVAFECDGIVGPYSGLLKR